MYNTFSNYTIFGFENKFIKCKLMEVRSGNTGGIKIMDEKSEPNKCSDDIFITRARIRV